MENLRYGNSKDELKQSDIYIYYARIKKELNAGYTASLELICDNVLAMDFDVGSIFELDDDLFRARSITIQHTSDNVLKINVEAEHISYDLIDNGLDKFIEDKKQDYSRFKDEQEKLLQAFVDKQAQELKEYSVGKTAEQIETYKKIQVQKYDEFVKAQKENDGKYEYIEKNVSEIVRLLLANTMFTLRNCTSKKISIRYDVKTSIKEVLYKIANASKCEIIFDRYNIDIVENAGVENKNLSIKIGENLSNLTIKKEKNLVVYEVDFVDNASNDIRLGDSVLIEDIMPTRTSNGHFTSTTARIQKVLKVISIDYDVFNRFDTKISVAEGVVFTADDFAQKTRDEVARLEGKINGLPVWEEPQIRELISDELNDFDDVIDEKLKNLDMPGVVNTQITKVFKTEVIKSDVIHSMTAWIDELEVNYLRTNFKGRINNAGGTWNYFYIKDISLKCITAELSATEKEPYKTISGKQIYWTAIGSQADSYSYFTLKEPVIQVGSKAVINGVEKELQVSDFYVMVPKIVSEYVKFDISFTDIDSELKGVPVLTLGTGNGQGINGGKAKIYKDKNGLAINYFVNDSLAKTINLGDSENRLRNVSVYNEKPSDLSTINEGDIVAIIENTNTQPNDE